MRLLAFFVATFLLAANCHGEETAKSVTIPLDQIWALDMPGTQEFRSIKNSNQLKQLEAIQSVLGANSVKGKDAPACFAVVGTGPNAILGAYEVLVEGKSPLLTLKAEGEMTIVFFSYRFGRYVHLQQVTRHGNVVEIEYRFVPHKSKDLTEQLALIPLPGLPAGKVNVSIVQLPLEEKFSNAGWKPVAPEVARCIVCNSTSLVIE